LDRAAGRIGTKGAGDARAWRWLLALPLPVLAWHTSLAHELAAGTLASAPGADPAAAWVGVAAAIASASAEAGFYGMLLAACGRRLPFVPAMTVILLISMLEPASTWIASLGSGGAAAPLWKLLLLGARAAGPSHGGFAAAFRSLGILAIARMLLWARALAAWSGASGRASLALVAAAWLVSHLALGGLLALLWGRSAT